LAIDSSGDKVLNSIIDIFRDALKVTQNDSLCLFSGFMLEEAVANGGHELAVGHEDLGVGLVYLVHSRVLKIWLETNP